ncbi:YifB family Mg chelatase-like AAA ATPase [Glaciecola sp. MH2013]|uniref:YifB family Mg chelatase-like AAA ATPase n=1 Tax=Glaciecola sp. MH2013 TaxID=2785524 RepID=UPI00189FE1E2|nr:YifB family Mg chelatase-like AAA ATPase [Glaciecola sp. MH2013]MBF7074456.1 YifB family Mg chelatase-like AAA ATPase [Glaciecola sp. MH2013]
MSLSVVYTRANLGVDAPLVTIEVHLSNGLPAFNLVGLPETTVKESRDRVRSALINADFEFPAQRITVNMAPADLPKGGSRFDLAIAIGIIAASEQLKHVDLSRFEFIGELALSGKLRSIQGALPMAFAASKSSRQLILPFDNGNEASLVSKAQIIAASTLTDVYLHLVGKKALPPHSINKSTTKSADGESSDAVQMSQLGMRSAEGDMSDIVDQQHAKRALEIAAAGGHNVLFFGPAGTGKSMLANRLLSIMPELDEESALASAAIRSISGEAICPYTWRRRAFRQPHHTSSATALVGGGSYPKPGEISLAHNGVLFLDELPEFGRHILDVLREPMETGEINISRAAQKVVYPAEFQLVAAMNPSPTGDIDDNRATPDQVIRYLNRISGPFLDRIDLQVNVPKVDLSKTLRSAPSTSTVEEHVPASNNQEENTSAFIKAKVVKAQAAQIKRQGRLNKHLNGHEIERYCPMSEFESIFLAKAMESMNLSMRAYHRTMRVARTIADLDGAERVNKQHLAEALSFRSFDRMLNELVE